MTDPYQAFDRKTRQLFPCGIWDIHGLRFVVSRLVPDGKIVFMPGYPV